LVYVDECGLEESIRREYARSPQGEKVVCNVSGKRRRRTSIIAGLHTGKPIAPLYFQGYCDTKVVLSWMEAVLLPELQPGMVIIWDNASFHQSPKFKALIESVGCTLLPLPPYSPDLNPIEQWWSVLKARIRRWRHKTKMTIAQSLCKIFNLNH
jgi:transposase